MKETSKRLVKKINNIEINNLISKIWYYKRKPNTCSSVVPAFCISLLIFTCTKTRKILPLFNASSCNNKQCFSLESDSIQYKLGIATNLCI